MTTISTDGAAGRHHLDRRAKDLIEAAAGEGPPDDLLTTAGVSAWLGISVQWLDIGRCRGYGPAFVRLSPRRIRYRRADVIAWLSERTHRSTAGYAA
jgi:predicted DNA-binding transcriptional regulator AlpA